MRIRRLNRSPGAPRKAYAKHVDRSISLDEYGWIAHSQGARVENAPSEGERGAAFRCVLLLRSRKGAEMGQNRVGEAPSISL